MELASFAAAVLLALVHVLAGRLELAVGPPRSIWLSVGGGASVAYVALHLLPELQRAQDSLRLVPVLAQAIAHPGYAGALAGIALFHGLDRLAAASSAAREKAGKGGGSGPGVFSLHIGFFTLYNALLGHLLAQGADGMLLPYAGALALHFTVNDAEPVSYTHLTLPTTPYV